MGLTYEHEVGGSFHVLGSGHDYLLVNPLPNMYSPFTTLCSSRSSTNDTFVSIRQFSVHSKLNFV